MSIKNKVQFGIIAIVVIIILGIISFYFNKQISLTNLNNMNKDIKILDNEIAMYYLENNNLPIKENAIKTFNDKSINPNDEMDKFYEIDLSKLDISNLTYGKKDKSTKDFYIINVTSHTIYYYQGIEYKNEVYYTRNIDYKKIDLEKY